MSKKMPIIAIAAMSIVIVVSVVLVILFISNPVAEQKSQTAIKKQATSDMASASFDEATKDEGLINPEETVSDMQATEQPTTEPDIIVPDSLSEIMAKNATTAQDLSSVSCKQLVTVSATGANAQVNFYTLENNEWKLDESLSCSGFVGANGVTSDMHEGGYATPKGLYSISEAFYIYQAPSTALPMFEITNETYWVDDPDSAYYNKRVEGTANKDWDSAEHMVDYTVAYEYGFVIDYNEEAKYNAGSAIFFHVSYDPTAGCVGVSKDYVLKYLAALDPQQSPYILIV